jgi:hypothetical protein
MRFGTWKLIRLYRAGSLVSVSKENILKYKLDLVGVQKVIWVGGSTKLVGKYTFFFTESGRKAMNYAQVFVHKRIILAVKKD